MTEVLEAGILTDDFQSEEVGRNPSQTPPYFLGPDKVPFNRSSCQATHGQTTHAGPLTRNYTSVTPSEPSSPRISNHDTSSQTSYISTPSSSLSLEEDYCDPDEAEDITFPTLHSPADYYDEPSLNADRQYQVNSGCHAFQHEWPDATPVIASPVRAEIFYRSVGDDTSLASEPSRHVDYLSHDWREEDIWCSWRHIVSRRHQLENHQRLENASWRTWAKSRNNLKTVSPERLNWMKDHDVTWLYGPLQTIDPENIYVDSPAYLSGTAHSPAFASRKPILKKRSLSEVMLRRSLSNSTLVRQAVDALSKQDVPEAKGSRPKLAPRAASDYGIGAASMPRVAVTIMSPPMTSYSAAPSTPTPVAEKRHIHFNNKVEQCIAINDDTEEIHRTLALAAMSDTDDSSDDGITIRRADGSCSEQEPNSVDAAAHSGDCLGSKTIAMLPSTTLNYRSDTPEPPEQAYDRIGSIWQTGRRLLSHASSSETLRPVRPSANFLLDDQDDEDDDINNSWQARDTTMPNRGVTFPSQRRHGDFDDDEEIQVRGLRRTSSGMLMPYEGDDPSEDTGIVGKVLDTVNTARDIAHVIWNVGWRR